MIFGLFLFVCGVVAGVFGFLLIPASMTNALLAFLISAVLISAGIIVGAIIDLEKEIKKLVRQNPPPLPQ